MLPMISQSGKYGVCFYVHLSRPIWVSHVYLGLEFVDDTKFLFVDVAWLFWKAMPGPRQDL